MKKAAIAAHPFERLSVTRDTVRQSTSFKNRGLFGGLILGTAGIAILFSRPILPESGLAATTLNVLGWSAFLAYVGIRLWSTLFIGGRKGKILQTTGPYSICRNPLYWGSFFFALAVAFFLKSAIFGTALLLMLFIYSRWVVRAEEFYLEKTFENQFRDYCRRVPRFWPRFAGFKSPAQLDVELLRLRQEAIRLARAGVLCLAMMILMRLRMESWWPHWFVIP